ncbi:hypothetical protein LSH36_406g02105, partial [Paralvinella palmiformis]
FDRGLLVSWCFHSSEAEPQLAYQTKSLNQLVSTASTASQLHEIRDGWSGGNIMVEQFVVIGKTF